MRKAPASESKRLSLLPEAASSTRSERAAISLQELVIEGKRYQLVPLEQPRRMLLADVLTAREIQIATLVAEGRVNKQIAAELSISEWTVSTHLRRIFAKLDVDTRAAMVSRCFGRENG